MARLNKKEHYIRIDRDKLLEDIKRTKSGSICSAKLKILSELDIKYGLKDSKEDKKNKKQEQQKMVFAVEEYNIDSDDIDSMIEQEPYYILEFEDVEPKTKARDRIKEIEEQSQKTARTQDGRIVKVLACKFVDAIPTEEEQKKIEDIKLKQKELEEQNELDRNSVKLPKAPKTKEEILQEVKEERGCTISQLKRIFTQYIELKDNMNKLEENKAYCKTKDKEYIKKLDQAIEENDTQLKIIELKYGKELNSKKIAPLLQFYLDKKRLPNDEEEEYQIDELLGLNSKKDVLKIIDEYDDHDDGDNNDKKDNSASPKDSK
jgi:hypothetical protein